MRAEPAVRGVAEVVECDVAAGIPAITAPPGVGRALVLVRAFTEPLGLLDQALPAGGLSAPELARSIVRELEPQLRERFAGSGLFWTVPLATDGLRPPRTPPFLLGRARALRDGPRIAVAICTRDRPEAVARALEGVGGQDYPRLRTVVVDNAPTDDRTRRLVSELATRQDIDYVCEPRPGLSWARNRAIDRADGDVIAWLDDDAICDRWWASEIARGFVEVPAADVVTGTVVPSELATLSQWRFEHYVGVRRGRGFARAVFSPATADRQSPLYPLPPFGCGGNMAFRREAIERVGRFDCALGSGTATMAGEDTAAFSAVLLAGGTIVYQPSALVRHRHPREDSDMTDHMLGYGRGLTAFYTSTIVHHPGCAMELARLGPRALRDEFSRRGRRHAELDAALPRELLHAHRVGLAQGPFMYALAQRQARRLRRGPARA